MKGYFLTWKASTKSKTEASLQVAWMHFEQSAILTVHNHVITRNPRISVTHDKHRTWFLHISNVQEEDKGRYMCQINTVTAKTQFGYLHVVGKCFQPLFVQSLIYRYFISSRHAMPMKFQNWTAKSFVECSRGKNLWRMILFIENGKFALSLYWILKFAPYSFSETVRGLFLCLTVRPQTDNSHCFIFESSGSC